MGEKLVKLLDCEDKEEANDDSDDENDDKLSNTSKKTCDKTMNLNERTPLPPPNTAKEMTKPDVNLNQNFISLIKHEQENTPNPENVPLNSTKKIDDVILVNETNENLKKSVNNVEIQAVKVELPENKVDLEENLDNDSKTNMNKTHYDQFLGKTYEKTEKNEEIMNSISLFNVVFNLPNQIREERKNNTINV